MKKSRIIETVLAFREIFSDVVDDCLINAINKMDEAV